MLRIVVCSAALIAVIAGLRWFLTDSFETFGFGWGIAICIAVGTIGIIGAYLSDRADTRSQEALPPKPHDYR